MFDASLLNLGRRPWSDSEQSTLRISPVNHFLRKFAAAFHLGPGGQGAGCHSKLRNNASGPEIGLPGQMSGPGALLRNIEYLRTTHCGLTQPPSRESVLPQTLFGGSPGAATALWGGPQVRGLQGWSPVTKCVHRIWESNEPILHPGGAER